jgi:type II secretory pathway component PulJ
MGLKQTTYNILKGKFLVDDNALKNWLFIIFLAILALLMIASSHSIDKKVQRIAELKAMNKELRAEFVAVRADLMKKKMESSITKKIEAKGLFVSNEPPVKIKINTSK